MQNALNTIVKMLGDVNQSVRESTSWTLAKICETAPEPLNNPQLFSTLIAGLLNALKDTPRIANQTCFAIHNLAESLKPCEGQTSGVFSGFFSQIIEGLWNAGFSENSFSDGLNLAHAVFAAMAQVIQFSSNDILPLLDSLMKKIMGALQSTMTGGFPKPGKIEEYQGYFCAALQPILIKLQKRISPEISEQIMNLLIETFKKRGNVYDEGILLAAGLASGKS